MTVRLLLAACAVLLCACSGAASRPDPSPTGTPSAASAASAASSRAASSTIPQAPRTLAQVCRGATEPAAVASCVSGSLTRFWTRTLGQPVTVHVVVGYPLATMPKFCRQAARGNPDDAFACPENHTAYLGPQFIADLRRERPTALFAERLAATMGHESGHLVQEAVREPAMAKEPYRNSRLIEQQADCLSGVWAADVHLGVAPFLQAMRGVVSEVDDPSHRRDHGTVAQRVAATRRGILGGTSASCRLTVRHH